MIYNSYLLLIYVFVEIVFHNILIFHIYHVQCTFVKLSLSCISLSLSISICLNHFLSLRDRDIENYNHFPPPTQRKLFWGHYTPPLSAIGLRYRMFHYSRHIFLSFSFFRFEI